MTSSPSPPLYPATLILKRRLVSDQVTQQTVRETPSFLRVFPHLNACETVVGLACPDCRQLLTSLGVPGPLHSHHPAFLAPSEPDPAYCLPCSYGSYVYSGWVFLHCRLYAEKPHPNIEDSALRWRRGNLNSADFSCSSPSICQ